MINFLRKILERIKSKPGTEDSCFSIEFYPLTNRYYPKYKDYYLKKVGNTGIIEPIEEYLFTFAKWGRTEKEADKIIEMFKEQRLKKNVVTIKNKLIQ